MTDDQRWSGFIDFIDEPLVNGWAYDARNPNLPLLIQIAAAGGRTEIVRADIFRQDLKDHGIGDGRHGFVADLQNFSASDGAIEISILGGDCVLAKDIHLNSLRLRDAIPPVPESFFALMMLTAAELRTAAASAARDGIGWSRSSDCAEPSPAGRSLSAILLETACPERDPEGLISKFLRYEVIRSGVEDLRAKLAGKTKDRLDVLLWYIADYSLRWGRSFSIPLSEAQIRYLNNSLPISDFPASISVALLNILRRERPDLLNVTDPEMEDEALYWWCFEKTHNLNLERKLVTPDQASALRKTGQATHGRFPLSTFMRLHIAKNPELHCLNLQSDSGRLAALHYFLLLSCKHPHITDFLPVHSMRALLGQQAEGTNIFEDNLSFLLQDLAVAQTLAGEVRLRGGTSAVASGSGLSQSNGRRATLEENVRDDADEGVAVIGPIDKTSGLGQATRLSYQILERGGAPNLSALPFNVENPALVGFSSRVDYHPLNRPRRINLFHLNAESVPLAFAILPKAIFENSRNIGYFFWELDKMPSSHYLALDLLDEIWVSSEYVRKIYATQTQKPVVNVGMAVEKLPPNLKPHPKIYQEGAFTFLTTFDSFSFAERKNPLAVVHAFQAAFDRQDTDVSLIIKTWNKSRVSNAHQVRNWHKIDDLIRDDPRIQIIDETFTYEQILSLKLACNCYVSLHRAEGFGFGMLEAMQLGRPVIATAYSGNMEFCRPENSYLVDYKLVLVGPDEYPFVEKGSLWAEPDIRSAACAMRDIYVNRGEASRKGANAAKFVTENFSVAAIAERYLQRIQAIKEHQIVSNRLT